MAPKPAPQITYDNAQLAIYGLLLLWSSIGAVWLALAPETIPSGWSIVLLIFLGAFVAFPYGLVVEKTRKGSAARWAVQIVGVGLTLVLPPLAASLAR